MYSIVFALFCLSFLFLFGMFHTLLYVRKMKQQLEQKRTYIRYAKFLGMYGCVCLLLGVTVYFYGVA